jgi:hypothetical protein
MIDEIHPIAKTPIDTAFPVFFCWWTLLKHLFMTKHEDLEDDHQKIIDDLDTQIEEAKTKHDRKMLKMQKRSQQKKL